MNERNFYWNQCVASPFVFAEYSGIWWDMERLFACVYATPYSGFISKKGISIFNLQETAYARTTTCGLHASHKQCLGSAHVPTTIQTDFGLRDWPWTVSVVMVVLKSLWVHLHTTCQVTKLYSMVRAPTQKPVQVWRLFEDKHHDKESTVVNWYMRNA